MPAVFLCYSRADAQLKDRVVNYLVEGGLEVWVDDCLEPGTPQWTSVVSRAIKDAPVLIALLTPAAIESRWVDNELHYALAHGTPIVPLLARGSLKDSIPISLIGFQVLDMAEPEAMARLVDLAKDLRSRSEGGSGSMAALASERARSDRILRGAYPAGLLGELFHSLHDLYEAAGCPRVHDLAERAGVSSRAIYRLFDTPTSQWQELEPLILALDGDEARFQKLNEAALDQEFRSRELIETCRNPADFRLQGGVFGKLYVEQAVGIIAELTDDAPVDFLKQFYRLNPERAQLVWQAMQEHEECEYARERWRRIGGWPGRL